MNIRFSKVKILDNNEFDYDNANYLCSIYHEDYTEYSKLLHFMKAQDEQERRNFGKIQLIYDDKNGIKHEDFYTIADIILSVPKDNIYMESIEVYVYENP